MLGHVPHLAVTLRQQGHAWLSVTASSATAKQTSTRQEKKGLFALIFRWFSGFYYFSRVAWDVCIRRIAAVHSRVNRRDYITYIKANNPPEEQRLLVVTANNLTHRFLWISSHFQTWAFCCFLYLTFNEWIHLVITVITVFLFVRFCSEQTLLGFSFCF